MSSAVSGGRSAASPSSPAAANSSAHTHRAEVGHLEQRIDQLRILAADLLAQYTDRDRPDCGSPRARSRWVDARTLRSWRGQLVTPEPEGAGQ